MAAVERLPAGRRRLHALGHDPQQGPAAGDLSHQPVQPHARHQARRRPAPRFSFPELLATANSVIAKQVELREGFYDRNDVTLSGHGAVHRPAHARIVDPASATKQVTADAFVIATGSRPFRPKDVDFTHPRIFDSDTLLSLDRTPASIAVYGAGVVGCEYASMWRKMQVRVQSDQHARQTAVVSRRRNHRRA